MAGSVVATQSLVSHGLTSLVGSVNYGIRQIVKTSLAWTSDASGNVSGTAVELPPGTIVAVEFIPGSGGTQPSDLYDVTFTDAEGVNMFDDGAGTSVGANLSNATSSHKVPFVGGGSVTYVRQWLHGGNYTLVVAAAGNAKTGTVDVYVCLDVI